MIEDPRAQNTGAVGKITAPARSPRKPDTWVGPAPPNANSAKSSGW